MTDAPKRIWAWPKETVDNQPSWIDEIEVSHPDSFGGHDATGVEYIRADHSDALIAEAVAQEREQVVDWVRQEKRFCEYHKDKAGALAFARIAERLERAAAIRAGEDTEWEG